MQNNTKSSVVAGILGVFLGAFGGHDWYLGNTKKAITHVSLCVGGFILLMIGMILMNLANGIPVLNVLFICIVVAAYVIIVGNGIWGFIEGVIIIAQGDAGLAAKGYKVADPATTTMNVTAPVAAAGDATVPAPAAAPTTLASPSAATTPATPAEQKPLEPAPLDNVITAAPAASNTMPASVSTTDTPASTPTAPAPAAESVAQDAPVAAPTAAPATPETATATATPANDTSSATAETTSATTTADTPKPDAPTAPTTTSTTAPAADTTKPVTPDAPSNPISPFA